jgi:DNA-binding NarL/FixJ family response regulator
MEPCPVRPRVLLISDHVAAGDALAGYLVRNGFDVVGRASNPATAAAVARATPVDVALIDGDLAGGWRSVVQALADPLGRGHIAVLSSYWGQRERSDARRCGIGAALLKRISGPGLAGELRALAA